MKYYICDTCALFNNAENIFSQVDGKVIIPSPVLTEIEDIKISAKKDEETKYKARRLSDFLDKNENKWEPFLFTMDMLIPNLIQNYDSYIVSAAVAFNPAIPDEKFFISDDRNCRLIAKNIGKIENVITSNYFETLKPYTGYQVLEIDDLGMADFYSDILYNHKNPFNLLINEYLLIKDIKQNKIIDSYKWTTEGYKQIRHMQFDSLHFGKITPFRNDVYQNIALDSFNSNPVTLIGGPAGSGKTWISLGYLFSQLERGRIDRIVIFCNPVAAHNSCKLGFYPGTKDEKLLSTQVGAVLASKLGGSYEVEKLISEEKIILMPAADCRGYEVPAHSGVYIMEAQNLDIPLLRLLLQRIGEDCITIVDGDRLEQVDMNCYGGADNGMAKMSEIFKGKEIFGQVDLKNIYRSEIARIADEMR